MGRGKGGRTCLTALSEPLIHQQFSQRPMGDDIASHLRLHIPGGCLVALTRSRVSAHGRGGSWRSAKTWLRLAASAHPPASPDWGRPPPWIAGATEVGIEAALPRLRWESGTRRLPSCAWRAAINSIPTSINHQWHPDKSKEKVTSLRTILFLTSGVTEHVKVRSETLAAECSGTECEAEPLKHTWPGATEMDGQPAATNARRESANGPARFGVKPSTAIEWQLRTPGRLGGERCAQRDPLGGRTRRHGV